MDFTGRNTELFHETQGPHSVRLCRLSQAWILAMATDDNAAFTGFFHTLKHYGSRQDIVAIFGYDRKFIGSKILDFVGIASFKIFCNAYSLENPGKILGIRLVHHPLCSCPV